MILLQKINVDKVLEVLHIHQEIPCSQPLLFVSYFYIQTSTISSLESGVALSVLENRNENNIYHEVTYN